MMTLEFNVNKQLLTKISNDALIANSQKLLKCHFTFSPEWDGLVKVVHFRRKYDSETEERYIDLILDEETLTCEVPLAVLNGKGPFTVGLYGQTVEHEGINEVIITCNEVNVFLQVAYMPYNQLPYEPMDGVIGQAYFKIKVIADNWDKISKVNDNIDDVIFVSENIEQIKDVGENIEAIKFLATHTDDIAKIGENMEAVVNVSNNISDIVNVSDKLLDVETVALNIGEVATVAGIKTEVALVALNLENIKKVAESVNNIDIIAPHIPNINTVGNSIDNVNYVGDNIDSVKTVATNINGLKDIASNITEILQAKGHATNAKIWSEGTDSQVAPLGGEHSAKGWAQHADDIVHNKWGTITGNIEDQEDLAGYIAQKSATKYHASLTDEFGVGDNTHYGHIRCMEEIPEGGGISWGVPIDVYPGTGGDLLFPRQIIYKERFIMAGGDGIYISEDGITNWRKVVDAYGFSGGALKAMTDNGSLLVAITQNSKVFTSSDYGENWENRENLPGPGNYMYDSVAYGNNTFIALSEYGYICKSADGITWTLQGNKAVVTHELNHVVFACNKFWVPCQENNVGKVYCSVNGSETTYWSTITVNSNIIWEYAFSLNDNLLLIGYDDSDRRYTAFTKDGANWSISPLYSSHKYECATFGNGLYVIYSLNEAKIMYSEDGVNWSEEKNVPITTGVFGNNITFGRNKFLIFKKDRTENASVCFGSTFDTISSTLSIHGLQKQAETWTFKLSSGSTIIKKVVLM